MLFSRKKIIQFWIPITLFLFSVSIKLFFCNSSDIANDEPFSIYQAQFDIYHIIHTLYLGNNPPFFEIILHYWISIFGVSIYAVRFLSIFFASLTIIVVYYFALKYTNERVAIIAALLLLFSNYLTHYSNEARTYTLFMLLCAISYYLISLLIDYDKWKYYLLWGIVAVLLCYTHYFAVIVLFSQGVCFVFLYTQRKIKINIYKLVTAILLILLLVSPEIILVYQNLKYAILHGTWVQLSTLEDLYNLLRILSNAPINAVAFIILIVYFLFNRKHSIFSILIITWFFIPFIIIWFISTKYFFHSIPLFIDKYLLFIAPAFYLIIAFAIDDLAVKWQRKWIIAIPIVLMIATYSAKDNNKRQVKNTINYIKQNQMPTTLIAICPDWFNHNFLYYYNQDLFKAKKADDLANENILLLSDSKQLENMDLSKYDQIIYLDAAADFAYPKNAINTLLQSKYTFVSAEHFPDIFTVSIYKK